MQEPTHRSRGPTGENARPRRAIARTWPNPIERPIRPLTLRKPATVGYAAPVAKTREVFVCRTCGAVQSRWMGKCPDCGAWDSLESERIDKGASKDPQRGVVEAWRASGGDVTTMLMEAKGESGGALSAPVAVPIAQATGDDAPARRLITGIGELDRVLGGGLVPGSVVLIGGDPGIGKSTLMLQAAAGLGGKSKDP
mgnify:CR=1 FL=1